MLQPERTRPGHGDASLSKPALCTARCGRGDDRGPDPTGRGSWRRLWRALALVTLAAWTCAPVRAGVLQAADLQARFAPPLLVGEKMTDIPVWPIFKQNGPATDLVGYVFESIDLAPIPGFSGTPVNLLVAMNPQGEFFDVKVISHHEPVFLDGLGEEPLFRFVAQYPGLSLKQNIKIGVKPRDGAAAPSQGNNVLIDGVAKATASVRIINQTMLAAALKVARSKLGYAGAQDPDRVAQVRQDVFEAMDWNRLRDSGLLGHLQLRNRDVEQAFAGSNAAHRPGPGDGAPDDLFIDLYAAFVEIPSAGRNLFDERGLAAVHARAHDDDHLLLLMSRGAYGFLADDYVRASVPDRLTLIQDRLPVELRDMDLDVEPRGAPGFTLNKVFRVIGASGLDLGHPVELRLLVTRSVGLIYPERVARDFTLTIEVPARYLIPAAEDQKGWRAIWQARAGEIAVLLAALAGLGVLLARQSPTVTRFARLRRFRPAYLLFTVLFIGWYAQGQLSIVNLVALLQASLVGRSWNFFLYDPMSTLLWIFVLGTLVAWGRGTFCGWLCPYGAMQELLGLLARRLRVPELHLKTATDRRLKRLKYPILAAILVSTFVSTRLTDGLVEIEPFKTAVTLVFVRSWPFVAWAAGLLLVGAVVNKFFCRYLCPLGAALALLGRLRRLDWIARRAECGTPCQTCRYRCTYQAIEADGKIDYAECFQCMDCVAIHDSPQECAPLLLEAKRRRVVPIVPVPAGATLAALSPPTTEPAP
jgi:transcriptional regulator of nitric oxide reductase